MRLIDADALKKAIPNTHVDIFENCRNCRLLDDEQVKQLIDDTPTIELLKEQQEAKTVIKIAKRFNDCDLTGFCPFCSRPLIKDWAEKYCGYCGNPVLWEGW